MSSTVNNAQKAGCAILKRSLLCATVLPCLLLAGCSISTIGLTGTCDDIRSSFETWAEDGNQVSDSTSAREADQVLIATWTELLRNADGSERDRLTGLTIDAVAVNELRLEGSLGEDRLRAFVEATEEDLQDCQE